MIDHSHTGASGNHLDERALHAAALVARLGRNLLKRGRNDKIAATLYGALREPDHSGVKRAQPRLARVRVLVDHWRNDANRPNDGVWLNHTGRRGDHRPEIVETTRLLFARLQRAVESGGENRLIRSARRSRHRRRCRVGRSRLCNSGRGRNRDSGGTGESDTRVRERVELGARVTRLGGLGETGDNVRVEGESAIKVFLLVMRVICQFVQRRRVDAERGGPRNRGRGSQRRRR